MKFERGGYEKMENFFTTIPKPTIEKTLNSFSFLVFFRKQEDGISNNLLAFVFYNK
jgi:hypothetical protein